MSIRIILIALLGEIEGHLYSPSLLSHLEYLVCSHPQAACYQTRGWPHPTFFQQQVGRTSLMKFVSLTMSKIGAYSKIFRCDLLRRMTVFLP